MVAKCHYGLIIGIQGVLLEVFGSQVIAEVGSFKDANVSSVLIYGLIQKTLKVQFQAMKPWGCCRSLLLSLAHTRVYLQVELMSTK